MTAMVTNLLDMARIQSGDIRLRVEWQSLEEIIGSALKRGPRFAGATPNQRAHRPHRAAGRMRCSADRAGAGQPAGKRRQVHAGALADRDHRAGRCRCGARQRAGPWPRCGGWSGRRHLRQVHPRQHRVGHAGHGPGPRDLPRDHRGAPRTHLGRADTFQRSSEWRHLHLHPAPRHAAAGGDGRIGRPPPNLGKTQEP